MTLQFREIGNKKGKTIIFLHAAGVSSWMWYEQQSFFMDYHCILVDLPEHGLSINQKPFTIQTAASGVVELIKEHAHNQRAFLIGHEVGAKVALAVLQHNANLVEKAVVSSVVLRSGGEAKLHKILPHSFMVGVFKLKGLALKSKSFQKIAVREYGVTGSENITQYLQEIRGYPAAELLHIIHEGFITPFSLQGLERVQTPTLVMVGEKELDPVKESARDVLRVLPNSSGIVVKNGKHAHPRVECNTFNEIVSTWLEDTPALQHNNVMELAALD